MLFEKQAPESMAQERAFASEMLLTSKRWWVGADTKTWLGAGKAIKGCLAEDLDIYSLEREKEVGKCNRLLSNISSYYSDLLLR